MDPNIVGKTIDSYQILDVLGRGGMGIVYRAKDLMLDKDVAVKMMDARLDLEGRLLKRFQEEARSLARLQHPNIVAIYTLRESQLGLCIVMEFVKGRNLSDIIKESGALPLHRLKKIFLQCLNALDHAHTEGIIHRDLKPSNIMLTENDTVKITDFGLAKRLEPTPNASTVLAGGTLYYSPPEQLDSLSNVDFRGDIYSLGMTMYEALTGKIPFADTASDYRIRKAIVEGDIPSPEKLRQGLPDDLVRVVMKAINKDPAKRFRSAAAMLEALENCGTSVKAVARPRAAFPVKKFAFGLLVAALAIIAYLLLPSIFGSSSKISAGNLTIIVHDQSGAPVQDAVIVVDRAKDAPEGAFELSDARTSQFQHGQLSTSSNYQGESHLAYRAGPDTKLQVIVEADSFARAEETFVLPRDSMLVVLSRLTPVRPPEVHEANAASPLTLVLHDRAGNPVPSAIVSMAGISGKEYSARTDPHGRAVIEDYPVASEGSAPTIRVAVDRFNARLRGKARQVQVRPGSDVSLDVNDFVPYDQTLSDLKQGVETVYDELRSAKDQVGGTDKEKGADPDYAQALELEKKGQRQFDNNDFENARASYKQAQVLFARSADRLAAQRAHTVAASVAKPPEKSVPVLTEPAKTETPRNTVVPPDMHGIVDKCRTSFEKEDLNGLTNLLRFTRSEQSTWSTFFDVAENIQVTTGAGRLQNDSDNAQIGFGLTISYDNKLDGEQRKLEGDMTIGLHYTNGKWEVVSHQFKKR